MLLKSQGDDCLEVNHEFIISLYGSDQVFTAEGEALRVRRYQNAYRQVWICVRDESNRFAFVNRFTGKFLGRDKFENLGVSAQVHDAWECMTFTKLSTGGYELTVPFNDKLCPVRHTADGGGPYMTVVKDNTVATYKTQSIGLHRYNPGPFQNFRWVIPGHLARSSAPHYQSSDEDQDMDEEAVGYLQQQGITRIFSFNSCPLPRTALTRLQRHRIQFIHIPVTEFQAPTLDQLRELQHQYDTQIVTLMYSGFGFGRVGTAISAVQLFSRQTLSNPDIRANYVTAPSQISALANLRALLTPPKPFSKRSDVD